MMASLPGLTLALALGATPALPRLPPDDAAIATIDLTTSAGVHAVGGEWRYSDVEIVETAFRAADADGQPTGAEVKTYDYRPHAGTSDFDDSAWQVVAPERLGERRGAGRLSFNWYRIRITVPQEIDGRQLGEVMVVFETSLDDYAEVWIDGELPRVPGEGGGPVVAGWNATNRLAAGWRAAPGQQIQIAVFGMNGPISGVPTNYIWIRSAKLGFFAPAEVPFAVPPHEVNVKVERLHPAVDALVPENAKLFKLAQGFAFTEGPVWSDGFLLFSDPNRNRIYRYSESEGLSVYREASGYAGADIGEYGQPGSNGLARDPLGRLTVNEHGNRRVTRTERDGQVTVLAERYQGKRLNSPNDLVYRADGTLYFTDPPFGLPAAYDDPRRELDVYGVYRVHEGEVELLAGDLLGPNGIAFSPDERFLYVGDWDPLRKIVMRYPVLADGRLGRGEVFFDMTGAPGEEAIDGLKTDESGNLYVSGPGGLWIIDPAGVHLGTIRLPRHAHNFAWGGREGRSLYIAARDTLYRMDFKVRGRQ